MLRTYRLALSATGEYTAFFGGTVAGALAAQVAAINRINQIYETDLSVRFEIIASNDQLIFTNAATDPFTNNDGDVMLTENQTLLGQRIGAANYDIGHVFSTGGGGIAFLGVVCAPASKASGVTGSPKPVGDAFYVDYVAHEIGHQFGGNHTFNGNAATAAAATATPPPPTSRARVRPSWPTPASAAPQNVQNFSDPYFHAVSLQEIVGFVTTGLGSTCGTVTPTGNDVPVVTAAGGYVLPIGTPFVLTGTATDATPDALTYTWEEFDAAGAGGAPSRNGVPTAKPFFRSFPPSASPARTFPQLSRLVAGASPVTGEALPRTSETLRFRLTARDNRAGGGAIGDATVTVQTDCPAGPFVVTSPNVAGLTFAGASTIPRDWDVANTRPTTPTACSTPTASTSRTSRSCTRPTAARPSPSSSRRRPTTARPRSS